ncbi:MAG: hypothetical protein H0X39_08045 [Actinobacteria bacterium]|nr:hypothetical protein [Actinomycetota bacterium]
MTADSLLSTRPEPARRGVATASLATLVVGALTIAIYLLLPDNAQSISYVLIGLSTVSLTYLGAMRNLPRGERLPWQLFALGLLGQVAGDAIFAFYEVDLNREPPSPSVADVFYLAGYPLLAAGIFLVLRRLGAQSGRAAVLDSIVVFGGVALVQWVFFIDQYNHIHFSTEAARVVAMAYPAVDALLLVGFAQLLVGPGGRTPAYRLLLLSVALWIVADEVYGLDTDGYSGGSWIDMLWLGSYVVWAAAALDPSMRNIAQADRRQLPRLTKTRLSAPRGRAAHCARDPDPRAHGSPCCARLCDRDRRCDRRGPGPDAARRARPRRRAVSPRRAAGPSGGRAGSASPRRPERTARRA